MNRTLKRLSGLGVLACFLSFQAIAQVGVQEDDPIFGRWVLDKSRSLSFGRPLPAQQTRIYEPHPEGMKATIVTGLEDGSEVRAEFVAAHDGVPSPFYGAELADEITLQRRGPYEAYVSLSNGAVEIGHAWRNISIDGNVMTIRLELRGNISSITVFNKQE